MVSRSVLKLDKGKNADCLVTIIPEQQHAFLYPNIVDSTFHHPPGGGWSPSLSREGNVWHASLHTAFAFLSFTQREKCHMLPLFLYSDIPHSTFPHQPKAGVPPFSPERETFCMLSFALTYSILLSTIRQQGPGCP